MKGQIKKRIGTRGVSWQIVVELPPDPMTGKRRQKFLTAPTKRGVEDLATELLASMSSGTFGEADAKKLTVGEYLTRWLASIEANVRPSSLRRYTEVVQKHITPIIGRVRLAKLTPLQVQNLYADRLTNGKLSPTTVALVHNVLHRALKQAVRWGLLTRNVTEAVEPPRETTPEYITWNEHQVAAFLAVTDQDEWAALWRLALLTGMRRGEILGLKWEDVDFARGVLAVKRTLSRGKDGTFVFGTPKTASGRRSIALPRSAVDSLRKHRVKQLEHKMKLGSSYHDQDLVFADALGDSIHPNTLDHRFKRLAVKAGLPEIRFHDLRHTSATLMLANGTHPKIVQERLGHSDVSMTLNRYSHVAMDMQREAADQLDERLSVTS
jgi:integrase